MVMEIPETVIPTNCQSQGDLQEFVEVFIARFRSLPNWDSSERRFNRNHPWNVLFSDSEYLSGDDGSTTHWKKKHK